MGLNALNLKNDEVMAGRPAGDAGGPSSHHDGGDTWPALP
jgi:hypothetical protein